MGWQDEVTEAEWSDWMALARKISNAKKVVTSLGAEDYAASAVERLLMQPNRPANVEAWLKLAIKNQYIDRFRKIQARGGASLRELTDQEWEVEMISHAIGSPSRMIYVHESVQEVLSVLNDREKEMLIMAAAGYDNEAIAMYLDYASNKVVATRLKQIYAKVKKALAAVEGNS
jgi:DNA-directed RNA polymerase specialized sigma24 family protein